MFDGELSLFSDTEVVSLVNLVKMSMKMFAVFQQLQPDLGELRVHTQSRNLMEELIQMSQLKSNLQPRIRHINKPF